MVIKDLTDKIGVDVSLETSGIYGALNDALRATGYMGTIVSSAYYTGDARALSLEGEWHRNRLTMISTRDVSQPLLALRCGTHTGCIRRHSHCCRRGGFQWKAWFIRLFCSANRQTPIGILMKHQRRASSWV